MLGRLSKHKIGEVKWRYLAKKTQGLGSSHLTRAFYTEVSWSPVVAPYVRCRKSYLIFANLASPMEKIE